MKKVIIVIVLLAISLISCSAAPEVSPTTTPKPTWTMKPHGTFTACIYYEDELVDGQINFDDGTGDRIDLVTQVIDGCATKILDPGQYDLRASYWKGECAIPAGCRSQVYSFVIEVGDNIEKDMEVYILE